MTTPEPPISESAPGEPGAVKLDQVKPGHHGHDVFVSYSSGDKPVADAIVARLEQAGIRCWVAPRDVLPGTVWGEAIVDAIGAARLMVLVLSGAANESRQVVREVELAASNNVVILPFRIESVVPTGAMAYFLASEHWLDAMSPPLEAHCAQLVGVAQALLGRQAAPAAAPEPVVPAPVLPAPDLPAAPSPVPPAVVPAATAPIAAVRPTGGSAWTASAGRGFHPSRPVVGIAIGAVIVVLVGGALAMTLGGRGAPSASPSVPASASAIGSTPPSAGATSSTSPSASPRYGALGEETSLKALLPMSLKGACEPAELAGLEIAAVACLADGIKGVAYELYAHTSDLESDWAALLTAKGLTVGSDRCSDGQPGEDGWHFGTAGSTAEGRVACYLGDGTTPILVWTDASIPIRVWIFGNAGGTLQSVYTAWKQGDLDPSRDVASLVTGLNGQGPMVPAGVRSSCERVAEGERQAAAVHCRTAGGVDVTYALYATRDELDADWTALREANGLSVNGGGRCSDGVKGESSWSYTADPDTTIRGRLLCAATDGGAVFAWTKFASLTRVTMDGDTILNLRDLWAGGSLDPTAPTS